MAFNVLLAIGAFDRRQISEPPGFSHLRILQQPQNLYSISRLSKWIFEYRLGTSTHIATTRIAKNRLDK